MKFQIKVARKATAELCEMNRICFVGIHVWNGYFQADMLKWKIRSEQEAVFLFWNPTPIWPCYQKNKRWKDMIKEKCTQSILVFWHDTVLQTEAIDF